MTKTSEAILKRLDRIVALLERHNALMISGQLLNECISPEGVPREAEECANIVTESYSAALCLNSELEDRNKHFDYQCAEFFVDKSNSDDDDDDDNGPDFGNYSLATLS